MLISFNQTTSPNVKETNGYGYAAKKCKESLVELGHEVSWRNPTADVEINFIQPEKWHWSGPYRIAYLPWESTGFRPGWIESLNSVDEVWTPSPVIKQWMVDAGVTKDVKVYQHGVESLWEPFQRPTSGTFKVLHHGAEALRKGGGETMRAFMSTLWDEDATLVMKMALKQMQVHDTKHIEIVKKVLPIDELVKLYQSCQLLCYPSWGEGFGLAPLQALATGSPVLVTDGWAPYHNFLTESEVIKSELVDSPWPNHHPGKMFQPDMDDLMDKLKWQFDNRDNMSDLAYQRAGKVHAEYNWTELTRQAFSHLTQ